MVPLNPLFLLSLSTTTLAMCVHNHAQSPVIRALGPSCNFDISSIYVHHSLHCPIDFLSPRRSYWNPFLMNLEWTIWREGVVSCNFIVPFLMLGFKVYYLLSSFLAKLLYDYFTAKAAISAIMTKGGKYVAYFILVEQNYTITLQLHFILSSRKSD